jgi:hypothetical protein
MEREMEQIIAELKQIITFKDNTVRGDIVLIATKTPPMLVYALVTSIEKDTTRKDEWWHVGMSLLTVPPQQTVWTLRTSQMTGGEVFTMGGEQRFVKAVDFGALGVPLPGNDGEKSKEKGSMLKRVK